MMKTLELSEVSAASVSHYGVVRIDVGRNLSPEELVAVARRVGEPQPFSLQKYRPADFPPEITLLDNQGDGVTAAPSGFGEGWHQDSTYLSNPPAFTVLHALQVPESGGETLFADTRPALQVLTSAESDELSKLQLEHSLASTYRIALGDVGKTVKALEAQLARASHPVVMLHPRGGATLCLSPLYTAGNVGLQVRELYERVLLEVVKGEVVQRWKAGEIVVWDNRVVLHAAAAYSGSERRILMRTVVRDVGYEQ